MCPTKSSYEKITAAAVSQIFEINHPLVHHHISALREVSTSASEFRRLIRRLTIFLAYEATKDMGVIDRTVRTPMKTTTGNVINDKIGIIPIIRAGLVMVEPLLDLIPSAEVWHLGLYRDEETAQAIEYYNKLPASHPVDVGFVIDPMLATGGSAISALSALDQWGVPKLKLLSVIAAPEGIRAVEAAFPQAQIFVCAVDERLDKNRFIIPGLGDAGDRAFNT